MHSRPQSDFQAFKISTAMIARPAHPTRLLAVNRQLPRARPVLRLLSPLRERFALANQALKVVFSAACLCAQDAAMAGQFAGLRSPPVVEVEEDVYTFDPANNGAGPMWCAGSTCIVRAGDDVFASGLE